MRFIAPPASVRKITFNAAKIFLFLAYIIILKCQMPAVVMASVKEHSIKVVNEGKKRLYGRSLLIRASEASHQSGA